MLVKALLSTTLPALALACASASGTYAPLGPEHPASASAIETPIQDPSALLRAATSSAPAGADEPSSGAYVCPMHAALTSGEPGRCPECGMELVPRAVTDEHAEEHHHDG